MMLRIRYADPFRCRCTKFTYSAQLRRALETRVNESPEEVDVNGWMGRTTLEMLGQAGLGYSFENFVEDSSDAFGEAIKMFLYVLSARLTLSSSDSITVW